MKFTEPEKQILIAVRMLSRKKRPNRLMLDDTKKDIFGEELLAWDNTLDNLIAKNILIEDDGFLALSDGAAPEVNTIYLEWSSKGFSEWLLKSEKSRAYSEFCRRLYGKDLCQCSMMDMPQLEHLLKRLHLGKNNRVLDLGCGIGLISEYISDATGARVTGLDFADGAISRARERTSGKHGRLTFATVNIDELDYPANSFDTIIAIDSLYFVRDLKKDHLEVP